MGNIKTEPGIRVLVISSIIPTDHIERKKSENDILFVTENAITKQKSDVEFQYLFPIPRAGRFLGFFSKKWKQYYCLKKQRFFISKGRRVVVFPQIILPIRLSIRWLYFRIGLYIFRHSLDKIIREYGPTVVHAHNVDSNAFIARWIKDKYNIPYIVTLREFQNVDKLIVANLKKANVLIAVSNNKKYEELSCFDLNYKVIPHGLSQESYLSQDEIRDKKREGKFKIISVGRLLPSKNVDLIIKKLNEIRDIIDFEFRIYGEGPEYSSLQKLILTLNLSDRIFLEGNVAHEDIKNVMRNADIFVSLSYPETFGRVFVESMAAGLPFIARKDTGVYGMVDNNLESFFCDETEFSELLLTCYNKPLLLQKVGQNARLAAERFRLENVANDLIQVYTSNQKDDC